VTGALPGLVGNYCWIYRSRTETLRAGTTRTLEVLLPPTGAHAIYRAWRHADALARGDSEILFTCEESPAACRNGRRPSGAIAPASHCSAPYPLRRAPGLGARLSSQAGFPTLRHRQR
jgi:hypothetical protein